VLYLPSLGACMAAALALEAACRRLADPISRRHCSAWPASPVAARRVAMCAAVALLCAPLAWQCARFATTWTEGVALWGHALAVQEARGARLTGGATTSAMCEYGMQLSWASRHREAEAALERPVAEAEALAAEAARKAGGNQRTAAEEPWGARGSLDMCGYMPLSLVLRLNGEPRRALAVAERCEQLVRELRLEGAAGGRETLSRCLSAKAMALYDVDRPQAAPTLQRALEMGRDPAGQIRDGARYREIQGDVGRYGEMGRDPAGQIRDGARYREIQGDVGRYGEMGRDPAGQIRVGALLNVIRVSANPHPNPHPHPHPNPNPNPNQARYSTSPPSSSPCCPPL